MLINLLLLFTQRILGNSHSNQNDILTVFMDITYTPLDTIKPKNARLIVDLYNKDQPKSVNNFKTLLTNVKGYKNTYFFKITGPALIGGDYEHNTGHGGQSIYGEPFREHTKIHKHKFGTLSTLSDVDGDVRSQFFFCLDTREDYDEYYTVIGKVRDECLDALKDIHSVRTRNEKPVWPVKIIECGYYKEEKSDL